MAQDKKVIDGMIVSIFLVAVAFTVAMLMIVAYLGIKIDNVDTCGVHRYSNYSNKNPANSSFILDQNNEYVLQKIVVPDHDNLYFEFCYDVRYAGEEGVSIAVINYNETIAFDYVDGEHFSYCTPIASEKIEENNILGLSCLNCNASRNITLIKQTLGDQVNQISGNNSYEEITRGETLSYSLEGEKSCRDAVRFTSSLYFISIAGMALMLLILVGFKAFKERLMTM